MYDIIIVGAGPAGLTAAIYALRANKKILVFEAKAYGGQIASSSVVENYPGYEKISGFDLATNMYNQVIKLGGEIKFEEVTGIKEGEVITNKGSYQTKAIILATGVQTGKLGLDKEDELKGKGVSYCATCDGNFFKGKDVALVGGGNTALEDALYLSNIVNKVYLIHRRDTFRADQKNLEELKKKDNVEFILNSNVVKLNGTDRLESIDVDTNGNINTIEVSGLFIAVGHVPNNEMFDNMVDLDERGYIKSEDGIHTRSKNIYVAGDTRVKTLRQLVTATSDGALAATTAMRELGR